MWRYLCPTSVPTKGWPQQRRILIIKWIAWPLSLTKRAMEIVAMVAGMEVMSGLSNTDFCSPWLIWLQRLLSAPSAWGRDQRWMAHVAPCPRVISQLPGDIDHIGPIASWKGQCFVFVWIDTYSEYKFAFPALKASARTTICRLTKCLVCCHDIPHSIASDQGTNLKANEVWLWASVMEFTCLLMCFSHPGATGLMEWCNGLL